MATPELRDVQKVWVLKRSKCRRCREVTSAFSGDVCPECVRTAQRHCAGNAVRYVADYFRDHPLFVPRAELRRLQDSIG